MQMTAMRCVDTHENIDNSYQGVTFIQGGPKGIQTVVIRNRNYSSVVGAENSPLSVERETPVNQGHIDQRVTEINKVTGGAITFTTIETTVPQTFPTLASKSGPIDDEAGPEITVSASEPRGDHPIVTCHSGNSAESNASNFEIEQGSNYGELQLLNKMTNTYSICSNISPQATFAVDEKMVSNSSKTVDRLDDKMNLRDRKRKPVDAVTPHRPAKLLRLRDSCLPSLTFRCNVCNSLITCTSKSATTIRDHYATHGITNVDIREEKLADGRVVLNLVELVMPSSKRNVSNNCNQVATKSLELVANDNAGVQSTASICISETDEQVAGSASDKMEEISKPLPAVRDMIETSVSSADNDDIIIVDSTSSECLIEMDHNSVCQSENYVQLNIATAINTTNSLAPASSETNLLNNDVHIIEQSFVSAAAVSCVDTEVFFSNTALCSIEPTGYQILTPLPRTRLEGSNCLNKQRYVRRVKPITICGRSRMGSDLSNIDNTFLRVKRSVKSAGSNVVVISETDPVPQSKNVQSVVIQSSPIQPRPLQSSNNQQSEIYRGLNNRANASELSILDDAAQVARISALDSEYSRLDPIVINDSDNQRASLIESESVLSTLSNSVVVVASQDSDKVPSSGCSLVALKEQASVNEPKPTVVNRSRAVAFYTQSLDSRRLQHRLTPAYPGRNAVIQQKQDDIQPKHALVHSVVQLKHQVTLPKPVVIQHKQDVILSNHSQNQSVHSNIPYESCRQNSFTTPPSPPVSPIQVTHRKRNQHNWQSLTTTLSMEGQTSHVGGMSEVKLLPDPVMPVLPQRLNFVQTSHPSAGGSVCHNKEIINIENVNSPYRPSTNNSSLHSSRVTTKRSSAYSTISNYSGGVESFLFPVAISGKPNYPVPSDHASRAMKRPRRSNNLFSLQQQRPNGQPARQLSPDPDVYISSAPSAPSGNYNQKDMKEKRSGRVTNHSKTTEMLTACVSHESSNLSKQPIHNQPVTRTQMNPVQDALSMGEFGSRPTLMRTSLVRVDNKTTVNSPRVMSNTPAAVRVRDTRREDVGMHHRANVWRPKTFEVYRHEQLDNGRREHIAPPRMVHAQPFPRSHDTTTSEIPKVSNSASVTPHASKSLPRRRNTFQKEKRIPIVSDVICLD